MLITYQTWQEYLDDVANLNPGDVMVAPKKTPVRNGNPTHFVRGVSERETLVTLGLFWCERLAHEFAIRMVTSRVPVEASGDA